MGGGTTLATLTPVQNLELGCMSGILSKVINYPLLVFKNNTQQGLPLSMNPVVVYRGLPMACLNLGGTTAVQFWSTSLFQGFLRGEESQRSLTDGEEVGAAFLGGLLSGVPCSIWELTMIQQQRHGGSLLGVPSRIFRDHGVTQGLFRGLSVTLGRESVFTMSMLGLCPVIQRQVVASGKLASDEQALAVGALAAAIFSATVTHPMDTIKTCLQGDIDQVRYKSVSQCTSLILEEHGALGVFKGLGWRIGLISTTFYLVNLFKQKLGPVVFQPPSCAVDDR